MWQLFATIREIFGRIREYDSLKQSEQSLALSGDACFRECNGEIAELATELDHPDNFYKPLLLHSICISTAPAAPAASF